MSTPTYQFSFGELASALTVIGIVGTVVLFLLSTKFVTKKAHYYSKDENKVEHESFTTRITSLETSDKLAEAPTKHMSTTLDTIARDLRENNKAMADALTKFQDLVTSIDKRVVRLEENAKHARR